MAEGRVDERDEVAALARAPLVSQRPGGSRRPWARVGGSSLDLQVGGGPSAAGAAGERRAPGRGRPGAPAPPAFLGS